MHATSDSQLVKFEQELHLLRVPKAKYMTLGPNSKTQKNVLRHQHVFSPCKSKAQNLEYNLAVSKHDLKHVCQNVHATLDSQLHKRNNEEEKTSNIWPNDVKTNE